MFKAITGVMTAFVLLSGSQASALPFDATLGEGAFGPFSPTETVVIRATVHNTSDHTLYFCNCVGDGDMYSFGGFASIPEQTASFYDFHFGSDAAPGALIYPASIDAGGSASFVFAEYVPHGAVPLGMYGFFDELQIFEASVERPQVGNSGFGGNWEVVAAPEPASVALLLTGAGILAGCLRLKPKG